MNLVVITWGIQHILEQPAVLSDWMGKLTASYKSIWTMLGISCLLFPKLALGMSGFETGVAVMPLINGNKDDDNKSPQGRIKRTSYLLLTVALIMSVFLLGSSFVSTLLIPPFEFEEGGNADGRALAYLAHRYLGEWFGTAYDISTIMILWFAGASTMAGLLNLVSRYLPRYGMAPHWASALRPLVIFFTLVTLAVTFIFQADVDAQAGAYATGVLVLFTSASSAVANLAFRRKEKILPFYILTTLVFIYTAVLNIIERPERIQIASFFIGAILVVSLISRAMRSTELRINDVQFDEQAKQFVHEAAGKGEIRILAHRPDSLATYNSKE